MHEPPRHLSKTAREKWAAIYRDFVIRDSAGILLLTTAMEAFDTLLIAQEDMRKNGQTCLAGNGGIRANPSCTIARDARAQMLNALKALRLDIAPPGKPGAPSKRG